MTNKVGLFLGCFIISSMPRFGLSVLYDYGPTAGDLASPKNDDGFVGPIDIPVSFHFFSNVFDSVFVNTNGAISFGNGVSQYTPDAFPLGNGRALVAVFWADVDTSQAGNLYYRSTNDATLMASLTSDLRSYFGDIGDFQAEWAFVVTWEDVTYFGGSSTTPKNTFQAVLVADDTSTFTIFAYDAITWTTGTASGGDSATGLGGTPAQVGFNAGDGVNYAAVPGSRTSSIVNIASTSNVGVRGKYAYKLDDGVMEPCGADANKYLQPRAGSFLGGRQVRVNGVCFSPSDDIKCEFDGRVVPGRYIGSSKAECITPISGARGRVRMRVSRDGGASYADFPPFTYLEEDPLFNAVHQNEEDWQTDNWAGSASVSYGQNYLSGVSAVNLDFVAIGPGSPVELRSIRLVTNAANNGVVRMPSRLDQGNIIVSTYGALRITPSPADGREIWATPGLSLWYLKFVFAELATRETQSEQQPTLEIFPTPPTSSNVSSSQIFQGVRDFLQSTSSGISKRSVLRVTLVYVAFRFAAEAYSYWTYQDERNNPTDFSDLISPPCTLQEALNDARFELDGACNQNTFWNGLACDFFHPGAANCVRTRTAARGGTGQQACYGSDGNILPYSQGGGTVDKYHPSDKIKHFFEDVFPFLVMCKFTNNCDKYGEIRPSQGCEDYEPPNTGGGWGDPHFITLDGLGYTFNAVGEFIVLQSSVNGLNIQGRMIRMVDLQGSSLLATVWNAFVLKTSQSDTVQVESSYNTFRILINGAFEDFDDLPSQQFTGVDVSLANPAEVLVAFTQADQEASMKITVEQGVLNYVLTLSSSYQGATSGLLGNNDGNPNNDLQRRNGDVLPPTTEGQALHNALVTWRTSASESIFTYGSGVSHATYQDEDFLPTNPSVDNLLNHPQASVCSGDLACLYDLSVTNDVSFASRTRSASLQMEQTATIFRTTISCGTPSDIPNGNVAYTGTSQSNRAYYSCIPNYQLSGDNTATCHGDGTWSGPPRCSQDQVAADSTQLHGTMTLTTVLLTAIATIHFL